MNANSRMVSTVKIVIECPEGKLLNPDNFFPMIIILLLSNTTAGLGTTNIVFSVLESRKETSKPGIKDSQIFGAYTMRMLKNDKEIKASPNWVRLNWRVGYCPRLWLI
jgi:hypothetical protein